MCVMYVEIRFEPCLKDERFTMGGKGGGFDLQHVHVWEKYIWLSSQKSLLGNFMQPFLLFSTYMFPCISIFLLRCY